jgi:tryptophan 2,3-dioxygenase
VLGSSSGFQSAQFRTLEFRLGLKDANFLKFQAPESPERLMMERALEQPSLYDAVLAQLSAAGISLDEGIEAAWIEVYRDTHRYWAFYQLAEKLLDLDDALLTWRHKHVVTVERIIGMRPGTGGTAGVAYLQKTLSRRCFPEIWSMRTKL